MKKLVTMAVAPALVAAGMLVASAQDRPQGQGGMDRGMGGAHDGVQVGTQAPNFILQDVDGDTHNLREYLQDDKIVVLEWFDPLSPFSRKYHEQNDVLKQTYDRFEDKDVVWLAVATFGIQDQGMGQQGRVGGQTPGQTGGQTQGQTGGQTDTSRLASMDRDQAVQILERAKDDLDLEYPILLDESGNLAKLYGVQEIPHVFIISKDGRVAYHGAIDNSRGLAQAGDVNYVSQALNQLTNNQPVSVPRSEPFGTSLPASAPRQGADQQRTTPQGGQQDPNRFGGDERR